MRAVKSALILLSLVLPTRLRAGERLVYAVNHGVGGSATEVFSVSPDNPQPSLIFSDQSSPVQLGFGSNTGTSAPAQTTVFGNRLFAPGKERALNSSARATGIFEFALDGSGRNRKILDLPPGERVDELIVDGSGTRLAYLSLSAVRLTLFIHDITTGRLLRKLDMTKTAGGCILRSINWLPDNKTLLYTLEEGADSFMEDSDYKRIGNWTMLDDGTQPTRLPASLGKLQVPGYRFDLPPSFLGIVNGQYLFHPHLYQTSKTAQSTTFLALSDQHSGTSTAIALQQPPGLSAFRLSRSGRYLSYVEQAPTRFDGNNKVVAPLHLWVQPMPAGDPKEILSLEIGKQQGASLTILGWEND